MLRTLRRARLDKVKCQDLLQGRDQKTFSPGTEYQETQFRTKSFLFENISTTGSYKLQPDVRSEQKTGFRKVISRQETVRSEKDISDLV